MAALRHVDRFDQEECRHVFNLAVRVPRNKLNVCDDGIVRIFRIEFAERAAGKRFILTGRTKGSAIKGWGDLCIDHDLFDLRVKVRCQNERN